VDGEDAVGGAGRFAALSTFDAHSAARRGRTMAATTEARTQSLRGGLTKEVNPPDRRPNAERRREIRAERHGNRQCRLGPS